MGFICRIEDHTEIITSLYSRLFEQYGVKSGRDAYFCEYPIPRKGGGSNVFRNQDRWVNISLCFPGLRDGQCAREEGSLDGKS